MARPSDIEFPPFYAAYIARVPESDLLPALEAQPAELRAIADRLAPNDELSRYSSDKWSVREVFGHLIDTERVMGYRAFCVARGESQPLPGFNEKAYVVHANSNDRSVKELAHEFAAVRQSNLWTIRSWSDDRWGFAGTANGHQVTARAIAYIMAGHVRHHVAILRERYRLAV